MLRRKNIGLYYIHMYISTDIRSVLLLLQCFNIYEMEHIIELILMIIQLIDTHSYNDT
jgi:hypothetical protein